MPRRRVTVLPAASEDIRQQRRYYLDKKTPDTAARWVSGVRTATEFLLKNPDVGEPYGGRTPELAGLRCWTVDGFPNHVVYYRPVDTGIEVVRVLGGFRNVQPRP